MAVLGDGDLDIGDAVDTAGDFVTPIDGPDPGRRSRHNQIAWYQLEQPCQVGDRIGDAPDLLCQIAVLTNVAINGQPYSTALRITDIGGGDDRRTGRRVIEGLSGLPRPAHFLGHALQIASRHIDTDCIVVHVIERVLRLDLLAARADGDDQLDLVVGLLGQRG